MLEFILQYVPHVMMMEASIVFGLVLIKPEHKTWQQWILRILFYVVWAAVFYLAVMGIGYVITKG